MAHLVLPNGKGHGWKPDTPDYRDRLLRDARPRAAITAPVYLKTEFLPPVRDQGNLGSCTGFGTTGALMYKLRQRKRDVLLSPLFAYYQARVIEGSVREDAGAEIRDVVKAAGKVGVSLEKCWPYNPAKFAKTPTKTAANSAKAHQAVRYYRCLTVDDVLQALALDMPVVGGWSCFANLSDADATGRVPLPQGGLEGGHCTWFVGGDTNAREFKFQNSWGQWGDHGFGYLPFAYMEQGLADDFWALDHE